MILPELLLILRHGLVLQRQAFAEAQGSGQVPGQQLQELLVPMNIRLVFAIMGSLLGLLINRASLVDSKSRPSHLRDSFTPLQAERVDLLRTDVAAENCRSVWGDTDLGIPVRTWSLAQALQAGDGF